VVLHEVAADGLGALGHRPGEAVQRRRALERLGQLVGVHLGDAGGVEVAQPLLQERR
jgi:hypothetical protein